MISRDEARRRVSEFANANYRVAGDELVVVDERTIDKEYGWVFFVDSKRFLQTHDPRAAVAGNAPLIVRRDDGSVHPLGTALPAEEYIRRYEAGDWPL